jgi:hypothetical protein
MPLNEIQKQEVKDKWEQLTELAKFFLKGDTGSLYVVDRKPMIKGLEILADLSKKGFKACWTRGKQGHG